MKTFAPVIALISAIAPAGFVALPVGAATPVSFGAPVLLTPPNLGGYEPGLTVDHFGNIVVTAHKSNQGDAVSPDPNSPTAVRSQSWLWTSTDGVTFTDMPGLTAGADRMDLGDEGDLTTDDSGNIYFVDTKVVDNSFTSWNATGLGQVAETYQTPVMGTAEPVDDRPWITAHGNGVVLYLGNQGDKYSYPLGTSGQGSGPGRYTAYMSTNGGQTWDHFGTTLPDSGWCRPAADHRSGSKLLYAVCTDDAGSNGLTTNAGQDGYETGHLFSYVSTDNGQSWARYNIDTYNAMDPTTSWPSVAVDSRGAIYALFNNADTEGTVNPYSPAAPSPVVTRNHLLLYRSTDQGQSWSRWEVTPWTGRYHYTWMNIAPDGTLGLAFYYAKDSSSDWYVYAGTSPAYGVPFSVTSLAPNQAVGTASTGAMGDFFECAFGPDNLLDVVWTSIDPLSTAATGTITTVNSDIYFAREKPPAGSGSHGAHARARHAPNHGDREEGRLRAF